MRKFLILSLIIFACSNHDKVTNKTGELNTTLELSVLAQELFPADSLQITISGADMSPWKKSWSEIPSVLKMAGINPGANRLIEARVFFEKDTILMGSIITDLEVGLVNTITLALVPLMGVVKFSIPVDLENSLDIQRGALEVSFDNEIVELSLKGEVPNFYFDPVIVPLGREIQVQTKFYNSVNQLIFEAQDQKTLSPETPSLLIELQSLLSYFDLKVQLEAVPEIAGVVKLPLSKLREPNRKGDLLFTELMIKPGKTGNDHKWVEIYNGSLDTLLLDNCKISKSRTGAESVDYLLGLRINPGQFVVLGKDSVPFADYYYQDLELVGTRQSLVLYCDNTVIDSIHYYTTADSLNPFPNPTSTPSNNGKSIQVPLRHFASRLDGSVWCAGNELIDMGEWQMWGSPGADANCED